VATVAAGGAAPEEADLITPGAVLVGSEAHGLPAEVVAVADTLVTIPLESAVDSLNAAVAGAVVLFEAARQRRSGTPASSAGADGTDWTTDPPNDRLNDR
jgi:TrmH family RNA methyltransferase